MPAMPPITIAINCLTPCAMPMASNIQIGVSSPTKCPTEDHQDADVEQVGAPHQLAPAQELAGARLPGVLLAVEAQQAAEQEHVRHR